MKHEVFFHPSGKRGRSRREKTILEAARELGISLRSDCGGKGTCGKLPHHGRRWEADSHRLQRRREDSWAVNSPPTVGSPVPLAIQGPLSIAVPRESLADEAIVVC